MGSLMVRENKLRESKHDTKRWKEHCNAADQRVITRLLLGPTCLTHTFLLKKDFLPTCDCCGTLLDVRHLILRYRKYEQGRRKYDMDNHTLKEALENTKESNAKLIKYLHDTKLYVKLQMK